MMATPRLLPGDIELSVRQGESILEAICREGFTFRFGCRRGGCGVCKADLVSGEVVYEKTIAESVLGEQERAEGVVLTCRAHLACDDVAVRLRPGNRLKLNVPLFFAAAHPELAGEKKHQSMSPKTHPD